MSSPLGRSRNRAIALLGAGLVVAAGVLLVARAPQSSDSPAARSAPATGVDRVQIKDFAYVPAAITVAAGTTITFTNEDNAPHTATSGTSPTPDGVLDSETLPKAASKRIKVTKRGTLAYYCALHPFMKGTVIVE